VATSKPAKPRPPSPGITPREERCMKIIAALQRRNSDKMVDRALDRLEAELQRQGFGDQGGQRGNPAIHRRAVGRED
jgi:hypothetical protein